MSPIRSGSIRFSPDESGSVWSARFGLIRSGSVRFALVHFGLLWFSPVWFSLVCKMRFAPIYKQLENLISNRCGTFANY